MASAFSDLFAFEAIDLADMSQVDPFVAANIVRGERLYCADRMYADELDLYVLRRAGDLMEWLRKDPRTGRRRSLIVDQERDAVAG